MRLFLLAAGFALTLTAAAVAQPTPRPSVPALAVPHWRIATGAGLSGGAIASVVTLSADRTWRGPLASGGRAWATIGGGFLDDGPSMSGGGAEAFFSVGTHDRWLDVRASAGLGLAVLDYGSGGFGCDPLVEVCPGRDSGFTGARPYALAGLGLDLYPFPHVGIGAEVRAALMEGPANVSMAELGLRIRLTR